MNLTTSLIVAALLVAALAVRIWWAGRGKP